MQMTRRPDPAAKTIGVSYQPNADVAKLFPNELPAGIKAQGYDVFALDGQDNLAVHFQPEKVAPGAPLVMCVHGSGGSVFKEPVWTIAGGLAANGVPAFAINTRQHDEGVNRDVFSDSIRDIEAAWWVARDLGHTRIVLLGHSLGTVQISFFAANTWHKAIAGVVLTGMPANLPWKSRNILIGDEKLYAELRDEALAAVRAGDFDRVLSRPMPWLGRATPATSGHFLSYRDAEIAAPRSIEWVTRLPYPVLMVRDAHDAVINAFEANEMAVAARRGYASAVTAVTLDSKAGSNGHLFEGSRPALVETIAGWVKALPDRAG
jgi:pimeloyl-ACP methyl ester carboxylesterase